MRHPDAACNARLEHSLASLPRFSMMLWGKCLSVALCRSICLLAYTAHPPACLTECLPACPPAYPPACLPVCSLCRWMASQLAALQAPALEQRLQGTASLASCRSEPRRCAMAARLVLGPASCAAQRQASQSLAVPPAELEGAGAPASWRLRIVALSRFQAP